MKISLKMLILTIALITGITGASAESLFTLGASQTYAAAPKSLYGGVQARGVGDLISIIMSETSSITNNLTYSSSKTSSTVDNFSKFLNSLFGHKVINDNI